MTRQEAQEAMRNGKKIRQTHYAKNEYLEMDLYNNIFTSTGFYFSHIFLNNDDCADGWEVYKCTN